MSELKYDFRNISRLTLIPASVFDPLRYSYRSMLRTILRPNSDPKMVLSYV